VDSRLKRDGTGLTGAREEVQKDGAEDKKVVYPSLKIDLLCHKTPIVRAG